MRSMRFAFVVACCAAFTGCAYNETKPVTSMRALPTSGLKNPGAYPSENFDRNGVSCGTRTVADGYVPFCNIPADGDEFDPRNQCAPVVAAAPATYIQTQPVTYVQQPVAGIGVGVNLGVNSDVDPMISAGVEVGAPVPTEY